MSHHDLPFAHAQLTGSPIPESWSQAVNLSHGDNDDKQHLGTISVVAQVKRTDNEDAAFFGRALLSCVEDSYYAKHTDSVYVALSRASGDAAEMVRHELPRLGSVALLIATISNKHIYASAIGLGSVGLFRDDQLYTLIPATPFTAHEDGVEHINPVSVSGILQPKDYVILGTESFFEHAYPTSELFTGDTEPTDIADTLSPLLLSMPQNAEVAAVILHAKPVVEEPAAAPLPLPVVHTHALPVESPSPPPVVPVVERTAFPVPVHPLDSQPAIPEPPKQNKMQIIFAQKVRPILYTVTKKRGASSLPMSIGRPVGMLGTRSHGLAPLKSKVRIVIAIIVLVIVASGIVALTGHFRKQMAENQAVKLYDSASHDVSIALSIKSQDPKKAESLLKEAQNLIEKAQEKNKAFSDPQQLSATIKKELDSLYQVTAIENPQTLFDLHLIKEGFAATNMALVDGKVTVVDAQTPTILRLDVAKQSGIIVTGGSKLPKFIAASAATDQLFALTQDGIGTVDGTSGELKQVIAKDALWGDARDIAQYIGNLYVLDPANKQIWKYEKTDSGYSSTKNVLSDDQSLALDGAQDITIDGAIWIAAGNKIFRITSGKGQEVQFTGMDQAFSSTLRIATTIDEKNLYVLDKDNKRVVVVSKEASFVNQYKSSVFSDMVDLAIDSANNRLLLLAKNKIVTIPVK